MPGQEQTVAQIIADEMRQLEFDEVWIDTIGNVCGRIFGRDRNLGTLVLNSHTDHVDPGDLALWERPPYAAEIADGRIVGRAACDIKGPLSVQIYSMAALKRAGDRPRRDVVFTGVVQEEVGGAGAKQWVKDLDYTVALVILGEPSSNNLSLGHRGVLQLWVTFPGRSVHASAPDQGVNPNYALALFLKRVQDMKELLKAHPLLGKTTVSPTLIEVDTSSMNVTPAWTRVLLDIRTAAESPSSLQAFIKSVAQDLDINISNAWAEEPGTPLAETDELVFGFYTPPESEEVQRARSAVAAGMGWVPDLISYSFATDGRHFAPAGIPILGYSSGEEKLAHTVIESISIDMMGESLRGHVELLRRF
jgi:putative selenium metabolism hydrolase